MADRCISNECIGTTGFSYTLSLINGKYKMTILYTLVPHPHQCTNENETTDTNE